MKIKRTIRTKTKKRVIYVAYDKKLAEANHYYATDRNFCFTSIFLFDFNSEIMLFDGKTRECIDATQRPHFIITIANIRGK